MDRYQQFIESSAVQRPEIAAQLAELGELYHKKLWHQLTVKLETLIDQEPFQRGGFLIQLYQNFIAGFAHKINLLKLAVFASQVSKQIQNPQVGCLILGLRNTKCIPAKCFMCGAWVRAWEFCECRRPSSLCRMWLLI